MKGHAFWIVAWWTVKKFARLGIKSCLAMNIIQYRDNDLLNKPETAGFSVYAVEDQLSPVTKEELMLKFPNVFSEGLGRLEGQYTIRLDETVPPVQHAPRRISVALRVSASKDQAKLEIDPKIKILNDIIFLQIKKNLLWDAFALREHFLL